MSTFMRRATPQPALAAASRRFASFSPKDLEAYRGKLAPDLSGLTADARSALDKKAKLLEWDKAAATYAALRLRDFLARACALACPPGAQRTPLSK